MDIFLFTMIFIAGTVFGSFYTLAVYRIPRKENITYVQSHCTSCNHKLGPLDLIPILSYVFLGGKCRYCKDKIRVRYVLLEIMSGFTFLLMAMALKINVYSSILEFVNLFISFLFLTAIFICGGIDKEHHKIMDNVLLYGIVVSIMKIILNSYNNIPSIENVCGFMIIPLIFLITNFIISKIKSINYDLNFSYIKYLAVIGLYLGFKLQSFMIIITAILLVVGKIFFKHKKIPLGFYMSIGTVFIMMLSKLI